MTELLIITLIGFMFYVGLGPRDKSPIKPAHCFRSSSCQWPYCTCHQHQHQELQS